MVRGQCGEPRTGVRGCDSVSVSRRLGWGRPRRTRGTAVCGSAVLLATFCSSGFPARALSSDCAVRCHTQSGGRELFLTADLGLESPRYDDVRGWIIGPVVITAECQLSLNNGWLASPA